MDNAHFDLCEKRQMAQKKIQRRAEEQRVRTAFIFALAELEKTFGHFWGHGLEDGELTPDQKVNRLKFKELRKAILDNGNFLIRSIGNDSGKQG